MGVLLERLHIKHYIRDHLLLSVNCLKIYQSDRVDLIGKDGGGKTTLPCILYKKIAPEEGIVKQFSHCGLIPQLKLMESTKNGSKVTRNCIQRALDKNPELLLTDEPTANLDNNYIRKLE